MMSWSVRFKVKLGDNEDGKLNSKIVSILRRKISQPINAHKYFVFMSLLFKAFLWLFCF